MPAYEISRTVETIATGHAASTGVARTDAAESVREALTDAGGDALRGVDAAAEDVYEFPAGPFDPYRVRVQATVTVAVEAADESSAIERGRERVADVLTAADLDDWEYVGTTRLDPAA
ncbi:MAG: hypothetical protein ABEJ30_07975 [Halorientalis sp.]